MPSIGDSAIRKTIYTVASNFAKYWSIFKIISHFFHRQTYNKFCSNAIIKYPTTRQMHRYTTMWNINVRNSVQWLTIHHKVMWQRDLAIVRSFTNTLLQIYCCVCYERIFRSTPLSGPNEVCLKCPSVRPNDWVLHGNSLHSAL